MFVRRKIVINAFLLVVLTTGVACSAKRSTANNQANAANQGPSKPQAEATKSQAGSGELNPGEATGSCTAKGETVTLKYAYAGRGQRFGSESIIVLLTDKPIPPEALADEIKSQTMFNDEKIRGLEYVFSKDGYWVRFHPSQYQESQSSQLKDYSVENDIVKGSDDDKGDLTDGKYSRSVKFVAKISR
jgi:hypothetical protein